MLLEVYQALSALTKSSLNFSSSALTSSTYSTANGAKKRKVECVNINISRPPLQLTPPGSDYSLCLVRHCHSTQRCYRLQLPYVPSDLFYYPGLALASNFQDIQVGVRNQFGYMKSGSSENTTMAMSKQPTIAARPLSVS